MLSDNGIANADTQHDGIANAVEQLAPVPPDLQSGDNGIANADIQHDGIANAVERWSEREQSQFLTLNS